MTSTPDPRLTEAHDLARAALAEITPASTVGDAVGYVLEDDGVVSLRFANRMSGYPGWFWTVSVAAASADAEPTVLEAELLPGDGALTAPDWVPWATRLADYQAAQAALATADAEDDLDAEDDDLDDDDLDDELDPDLEDGFDGEAAPSDGSPILHAGDLDGVDIDELDEDDDAADDDDADDDLDADDGSGDDADDDLDADDGSGDDDVAHDEAAEPEGDQPTA